jgi:hypothetical protein
MHLRDLLRPSTGDAKIGQAQSETREIEHGQRCLTSRRSLGRLGSVSGELDGRERGLGSPAASGGEGRARERTELREMRRGRVRGTGGALRRELGACAVVVAEKSDDVRECALLVHGGRGGGSDREGPRHTHREREREERGAWGNDSATGEPGPRGREEKRAGEETGADRSAPLGSEREREGAQEKELPLTGGVRLSGSAGVRPGWAELGWFGLLSPFLFL